MRKLTVMFLMTTVLGYAAPAAIADDALSVSANVTMVSDYRFRGLSLSNKAFAIQGGFDVAHESGFYVGTWASNISEFSGSTIEADLYGGYSGEANGISYDVGALLYAYPGATGSTDYVEAYGSVGFALGPIGTTVGANYAFGNEALGNQGNIYIFTDAEYALAETSVTLTAHFGYEDGAFGDGKLDWSIGASVSYQGLDFGVSYIDTNVDGDNFKAGVVFSIAKSF